MSGNACSLSGMMSATVAEAVAHIDQLWERVIGQCLGWEQWWEAVLHIPGAICLCEHGVYIYLGMSKNGGWGGN
jgi:hypothetical protein